jgi:MFS transporter, DHA2 family, multidrug resistance protein
MKTGFEVARAGRREWTGLAVLALPCMLYSMDLTVLNLAVPSLSATLKPTSAQLLWIVDIYGFMLAGALMTMGAIGDRIGRRKLLLIGAAAFGGSSVLAAFSSSAGMLIAMRGLLGLAGATLAPSTLSLIRNMFLDPRQRTVAIGVWVSSFSVGSAIGPLVGGLLLERFWWGSVFLIGVPVMASLLVLGPMLLPEFTDPDARPIDVLSAMLSLIGVLLVIYGIKQFAQGGSLSSAALSVAVGLAVGAVFVRRQRRLADPLIDLRLFHDRVFSAALATYTLETFVTFGMFVFVSQYLQLVLGLSPRDAGLWTMTSAASFIVGSTLTPLLARRYRPGFVMAGGLTFAAVGFAVLSQVGGPSGLAVLIAGVVIYSLGLAPTFTLTNDLIVGTAAPEHAGVVSAMSETGSELGGALGIALLGSLGTAIYRGALTNVIPDGVPAGAAIAARDTLGGALAAAGQLTAPLNTELVVVARNAFTLAIVYVAVVSTVIALSTAAATAFFLRHVGIAEQPRHRNAEPPPMTLAGHPVPTAE